MWAVEDSVECTDGIASFISSHGHKLKLSLGGGLSPLGITDTNGAIATI